MDGLILVELSVIHQDNSRELDLDAYYEAIGLIAEIAAEGVDWDEEGEEDESSD